MYLDRASTATFNVGSGATLTLGEADATDANADTIASSVVSNQDYKSKVIKNGAGTMTVNSSLDGLHSDTTVEAGTLNVNKDWTTANTITVKDGATLNTQNLTLVKGPTTVNGSPIAEENQTAGDLEAEKGSTVTAKDVTANDGTTIKAAQGSNLTADHVKVADGANVTLYGNAKVTNITNTDDSALTQDRLNQILGNDAVPESVKFGTDEKTKAQLTADGTTMSASFQTADAAAGSVTNTEVATLDNKGNLKTTGDITDGQGNTLSAVKSATDTNAAAIKTNASNIQTNTDAIKANTSNIQSNSEKIEKNTSDIKDLQNDVQNVHSDINNVKTRINKVGAGAAALANLHPLDFDANDKWNVAAAVGNYRDETATALGVFYRPTDRIMFNVSSTLGLGGHDNMIGAGVSFKLGASGTKAALQAKDAQISALQDQLAKQQAQIDKQQAMLEELMAKVK